MRSFASDFRYALRTLRASPGVTAAAVVAIAAGVGINTGIFSVLNGLALRDMPAPDAHELVTISQLVDDGNTRNTHGTNTMVSTAEYRRYRDSSRTLEGLMGYTLPETVTLGGDAPREVQGSLVTCNYFDVLQVRPVLGRGFASDACDTRQTLPEIVLGHELWMNVFAADPAIVGRTVVLNRNAFTIAGVAPEGFAGVEFMKASFFVPIGTQTLLRPDRAWADEPNTGWLALVGRRHGVELERIRAELAVIAAQIDGEQPGRHTSLLVNRATPLAFPEVRPLIFGAGGVVMAGFGLVLLIACANVANLLLARAAARGREIALRRSLGASRGRLVRQLLTESVLMAAAGGVLGSVLAFWSSQGLVTFILSSLPAGAPPMQIDPRPDFTVFAYAIGLTFATGLLFGLAPAVHASNPQLYTALKHGTSPGASGMGRGRTRAILVGGQVAMCLVLTISASLLLRGLYAAQTVDPGFEYRDVAVASFDLRGSGFDADKATAFNRRLAEQLAALPGVTEVAQATEAPLAPGRSETVVRLPGQDQRHRIQTNNVSPEYFPLLGMSLLRGRAFSPTDASETSTSIIVTEATARRFWPGKEPLGETLLLDVAPDRTITLEVVGVARDAYLKSIGKLEDNYVYFPAVPRAQPEIQTLVKTRADLAATMDAIREAARAVDPAMVARVTPLEDNLEFWRTWSRLVAGLAGALGALALVLASIGVYALVSYAVNLRIREVGIRIALGASAGQVLALVLRQNGRPVLVGAAAGVLGCVLVAQLLSGLLFGVSTLDPIALGGATAFVLGVALVAALLPARRAMRVDPMTTLRYE
ncbi:MAG TPA: ABC transporter permease [Gammaproteobacteria bacterium]|nr:ABC transporter permease [Gammaproteobacteria bacterium]